MHKRLKTKSFFCHVSYEKSISLCHRSLQRATNRRKFPKRWDDSYIFKFSGSYCTRFSAKGGKRLGSSNLLNHLSISNCRVYEFLLLTNISVSHRSLRCPFQEHFQTLLFGLYNEDTILFHKKIAQNQWSNRWQIQQSGPDPFLFAVGISNLRSQERWSQEHCKNMRVRQSSEKENPHMYLKNDSSIFQKKKKTKFFFHSFTNDDVKIGRFLR